MNTQQNTTQPNSIKTDIVDPSGLVILAEWFSLNERPVDASRDLGHVLSQPQSYVYDGKCWNCHTDAGTITLPSGGKCCANCGAAR